MRSVVEQLVFQGLRAKASLVAAEVDASNRIYFPTLDVNLSLGAVSNPTENNVLGVELLATHKALPQPIAFTAVGFGADLKASGEQAAEQWFAVVFPVLHALFASHESRDVTFATISARHRGSGESFQWRVIVGPVRVVVGGNAGPPAAADGAILHALKHEVTGLTTNRSLFWITSFVAVHADGTPVADCRLQNEPWPEATARLLAAAKDLIRSRGDFQSWRQLLLFEPLLDPADHQRPKGETPKPWWRKLTRAE